MMNYLYQWYFVTKMWLAANCTVTNFKEQYRKVPSHYSQMTRGK